MGCQLYSVNTRTIITSPVISSYEYIQNPFEFKNNKALYFKLSFEVLWRPFLRGLD